MEDNMKEGEEGEDKKKKLQTYVQEGELCFHAPLQMASNKNQIS
jgi:hypothetical protein